MLTEDELNSVIKYAGYSLMEFDQIPWHHIQHLVITAPSSMYRTVSQATSSIAEFYYNARENWLLVAWPSNEEVPKLLQFCPPILETLQIYDLTVSSIPSLAHLNQLTKLVISQCYNLTALPGLEKLTLLTELNLSGCKNLSVLPGLEELTQLTELNLSECVSLSTLPSLENLAQLRSLTISQCMHLADLPGLDNLSQLNSLVLHNCSSFTRLSGLSNLTQLATLSLYGCGNISELPGLENLSQLTSLDLSMCGSLTRLPGLKALTQLTSLNLTLCDGLTQLSGLEHLTKLTELNLSRCWPLTQLPGLEKLTNLTSLDLSGCYGLTKLHLLGRLRHLTNLDLSDCRYLTALLGLENLTHLISLQLSECTHLSQLSGLEHLVRLQDLDLSHCEKLSTLPIGLRDLKSLRRLKLRNMKLSELPDWLPEIAERFALEKYGAGVGTTGAVIEFYGTTVDGVDMSIFEQPYEMVVKWFEARKLGRTQPLNEIKVVFLGDGEAGKSHTIARLMNDGGDPDHAIFDGQSTPGIVIRNKDYDLDGRKIQVHYWDFGGQEIMHSMHRIFLTGRTMYVILLNARDDTQGDRARYWLHNVKSFAPDAPVLLVLNKIDQNENASVDEVDLRGRYEKLTKIVRLSALKYSQEEFTAKFTEVLLKEIKNTGYLDVQWPASWTKVKEQLENMDGHYILGDAYQAICETCQVDDNQKELLHWFNDLGVSFCCCDEGDYALEDYVILRPDWITNALYIILFNKLENVQNGLIPHASIHKILKNAHNNPNIRCTLPNAKYNGNDIQYVLGVMRKFNLSFPHGTDQEFVPMLCQQNSTVDVQYYHKDADTLEFNMEFDYLPNNLLHRLMVERHTELDIDNVWRTGARFQLPELGLSAVVVIDGNTLRFFIRYTDPIHKSNTYLAMLKANVDRIVKNMGLKAPECRLVYKLDGKTGTFDYEELLQARDYGDTTVFSKIWKRRIPIAAIFEQSAPESLENEQKLLHSIQKACEQIQREPECRGSKEDNRNRRMRDALENRGYEVYDQRQMGASSSRKDVGELDLMIYRRERDEKKPWSLIEALRVADGTKRDWNSHLAKLLDNYNPHGVPFLFLVTYADCEKEQFEKIWEGYQSYIQEHDTGKFKYEAGSLRKLNSEQDGYYIQTAFSQYRCGDYTPTVYRWWHRNGSRQIS